MKTDHLPERAVRVLMNVTKLIRECVNNAAYAPKEPHRWENLGEHKRVLPSERHYIGARLAADAASELKRKGDELRRAEEDATDEKDAG